MKIDKKEVPDSFQAYLVEGASFTKTEEYPILKEDMISKNIPSICNCLLTRQLHIEGIYPRHLFAFLNQMKHLKE